MRTKKRRTIKMVALQKKSRMPMVRMMMRELDRCKKWRLPALFSLSSLLADVYDIWKKGERNIVSPASAWCIAANLLEAESNAWNRLWQICRAMLRTSAMTLSAMAPRPLLNTLVTSPERRNATIMRASQQSSSCKKFFKNYSDKKKQNWNNNNKKTLYQSR